MTAKPKMTVLGGHLMLRGIASWMPDFQRAPTPGYAAAVLGVPVEIAERVDRLEFDRGRPGYRGTEAEWNIAVNDLLLALDDAIGRE